MNKCKKHKFQADNFGISAMRPNIMEFFCADCERKIGEVDLGIRKQASQKTYACGHEGKTIIMDDNELSISAWYKWNCSKGIEGDHSQCWDCWCKEKEKE